MAGQLGVEFLVFTIAMNLLLQKNREIAYEQIKLTRVYLFPAMMLVLILYRILILNQ